MPPRKAKKSASGDVFDGLTFCVSGSFSMSQSEMKSLLTDNGGKVAGSVTNAVTHVVSDQISSAKTHTAVGKGLPIVSEQWVTDSVEAGALSTDSDLFVHQPDGSGSSKKGKTASKKGKKKDDDEEEEEEDEEGPKKKAPAKKKAASKKAASKRKKADDDEEEEDEEDDPPAKKPAPTRKSGRATKSTKKADDDDEEEEEEEEEDEPPAKKAKTEPEIKKVVVKAGSAPVDDICPVASSCVVYQEGSDVWDAMLNQTNIGNNNNKYYVIQLLQNTSTGEYYAWNKWGRVGKIAGQALVKCGKDLNRAKQDFMKKFKDKTKNDWANRANFTPYNGKYTLLERDYSADDEDTDMPAADDDDADGETKTNGNNKKGYPDSKLDPRVQDLIKLICDVRMMEAALIEVGYDAKKLPLGKLSKRHIQQGYEVLKKISDALDNGASHNRLTDLSSEFYTLIPHDFGMTRPPVISTKPALKLKLEMVEQLADIEIATKLLKGDSQNHKINPLDAHYDHLKCDMKPLDNDDETVTLIKKYVKNTHAATHSSYSLEVQQVFDLDREGEAKRYEAHADNENRMLLWHGSRLTNFVGILSQGLRIAPPEAPVTGYMFGKGVYFADMVSKSANYCNASSGNNIACMLLCEVALGGMNQKLAADYNANKLPAGKLSTLGAGKTAPDPNGAVTLEDGVVVPCGPGTDSGVTGTSLLYNEFIVYDTAQIKMRYLIKMKFNYKR